MPLALQNVTCPWHTKMSLLLTPWAELTSQICMTSCVVSEATSLSRHTILPRMGCASLSLSEASLLLLFPLGTQLITLPQTMASPNGSWAESSLLVHTVVMMHRVCDGNMHRQAHVGWLAAWRIVIHLTICSQQKKSIFIQLCKSVI